MQEHNIPISIHWHALFTCSGNRSANGLEWIRITYTIYSGGAQLVCHAYRMDVRSKWSANNNANQFHEIKLNLLITNIHIRFSHSYRWCDIWTRLFDFIIATDCCERAELNGKKVLQICK